MPTARTGGMVMATIYIDHRGHIVRRWGRRRHGQRLLLLLAAHVQVCGCRRRCRKLNGCWLWGQWWCRCAGWCVVCALAGSVVQVAGHGIIRYLLKQPAVGGRVYWRQWLVLHVALLLVLYGVLLLLLLLVVVVLLLMHIAAITRRYGTCWVCESSVKKKSFCLKWLVGVISWPHWLLCVCAVCIVCECYM